MIFLNSRYFQVIKVQNNKKSAMKLNLVNFEQYRY